MPGSVTAGLFVNAHAQSATLGGATFDKVSVTPNGGSLPAGWTARDIGNATPDGSTSEAGGTFNVSGGGRDIWGTVDEGQFAWKSLDGDGSVITRLSAFDAVDDWAKAGVMIKQSPTAGDPYAALFLTKGHGVHLQSQFNRDVSGSGSAAPRWLKLTRTGTQLAAYESANGTDWTLVGRTTVAMSSSVAAGLVVTGHDGGTSVASATFTDVSVTASGGGALPQPWISSDVAAVQVPGAALLSNGVYTVRGSGNDVWGDTDEMHLVHQPINGDGSIIARVTAQENTSDWAKSGIILKESASPLSDYVGLFVTPDHGVRMQSGFNRDINGGSVTLPSGWLKLERTGSIVVGYRSDDGETWTEVGRVESSISSSAKVGMFVTSHNGPVLNSSSFTDVSVSP
jgi:regulation of enolase protein 1 (concanavalin A-like superfamily)